MSSSNFIENLDNMVTLRNKLEATGPNSLKYQIDLNSFLTDLTVSGKFFGEYNGYLFGSQPNGQILDIPISENTINAFFNQLDFSSIKDLNSYSLAIYELVKGQVSFTAGELSQFILNYGQLLYKSFISDAASYFNLSDSQISSQFIQSFANFLSIYTPPAASSDPNSPDRKNDFFTKYWQFMTGSADIYDTTDKIDVAPFAGNDPSGVVKGPLITLNSYRQLWQAYGYSESDFDSYMQDFYNTTLEKSGNGQVVNGWFIPSQSFSDFYTQLQAKWSAENQITFPDALDNSLSVSTGTAKKLLVLDRILRLLLDMVGVIQNVSAAQADRLNFLTNWQSAYTDILTQVPSYFSTENATASDGVTIKSPLAGDDQTVKDTRQEANNFTQSLIEKIRAWSGRVQDESKGLQSNINQTQDAINQQLQMASSLLQELTTLISQMFR